LTAVLERDGTTSNNMAEKESKAAETFVRPGNALLGEHPEVAAEAMGNHARFGGSTFNPRTGENIAGSRHYAVVAAPEATEVHETMPSPEHYGDFVAQHRDVLGKHLNSAVGTYHDPQTGLHHLEIVSTTPSRSAALALGKHLGESGVYHLATDQTHETGATDVQPSHLSIDERFQHLASQSPQKTPYSGVHFSDSKLDVIDGSRRGTGKIGEESKRLLLGSQSGMGKDAPPGFYTYAAGSLPEASIAQRKSAHKVRGQFAFASTDHPEFQTGYAAGSQKATEEGADPQTAHGLGLNAAEHALQDAGFDGYFSNTHPHIRFHFGSHALETDAPKKPVK
jgi:hypothetical protein